jgi:hypothetical protein
MSALEHGHGHGHGPRDSSHVIGDGLVPVSDCEEDSISKVRGDPSFEFYNRLTFLSIEIISIRDLRIHYPRTAMTTETATATVIAMDTIMVTWE